MSRGHGSGNRACGPCRRTPEFLGSGREVEELVREAEALGQMLAERTDAEGLGRVVATVDDVDSQFSGIDRHVMGSFPGHQGVETYPRRLLDEGSARAGDHPNSLRSIWSVGHDPNRPAQGSSGPLHQAVPVQVRLSPPTQLRSAIRCEPSRRSDLKGAHEEDAVPDLGMRVEGKVDAVEAQLSPDQARDLAVASPRQGTEAIPEEAMVDQQKVSAPANRLGDGGLGGIHAGAEPSDLTRAFHLKPIEGIRVVGMRRHPQIPLEIFEERF